MTDLDKNSRRGYQALRDALLLQFDNSGKMEVFRSKLKSHVRGKDESLPELTQLIQRLGSCAYLEAPLSILEVPQSTAFLMQLQIWIFAGKNITLDLEWQMKLRLYDFSRWQGNIGIGSGRQAGSAGGVDCRHRAGRDFEYGFCALV